MMIQTGNECIGFKIKNLKKTVESEGLTPISGYHLLTGLVLVCVFKLVLSSTSYFISLNGHRGSLSKIVFELLQLCLEPFCWNISEWDLCFLISCRAFGKHWTFGFLQGLVDQFWGLWWKEHTSEFIELI